MKSYKSYDEKNFQRYYEINGITYDRLKSWYFNIFIEKDVLVLRCLKKNQSEIAQILSDKHGRVINQSRVSRILKDAMKSFKPK